MMAKYIVWLAGIVYATGLFAQNDSTLMLTPERLGEADIIPREFGLKTLKALSATRMEEDIANLPFTVYIVTADDILRHGYVTLADVLKAAPGVRVSQPGNALEGETFLMRGLSGNQYVKILINDIPVKPSVALGMPIGAQLPVRQAERIEIMYGPAGALYGNEACAGVVNIILKETERPVFTQADLSFGSYGYNSLDVLFGGKLFKDKNIFRFSLYGSSTIRENTDVFYDKHLYSIFNYQLLGLDTSFYNDNPNLRLENDSLPRLNAMPHESRMFGMNFDWRRIRFSYNRMYRREQSVTGLNPLAVSYSVPSDRLLERMETFSLGFSVLKSRWNWYNTLSAVLYRVDNNSTSSYVFDRLSAAVYRAQAAQATTPEAKKALLSDVFRRYGFNERYSVAGGGDLRFETRVSVRLFRRLHFMSGLQANYASGVPRMTHFRFPVEVNLFRAAPVPVQPDPFAFNPVFGNEIDIALFGQAEWRGKRFFLSAASGVNVSLAQATAAPLPRVGFLYRIDSALSLYANYSEGFRRPSFFAAVNTYTVDTAKGALGFDAGVFDRLEKTRAFEAGLRYRNKTGSFRATASYFNQNAYNLIRDGYWTVGSDRSRVGGFDQTEGRSLLAWGVQSLLTLENTETEINRENARHFVVTWRGEVFAQYAKGKTWYGPSLSSLDEIPNMPSWMLQFRSSWRSGRFQTMICSNRQRSALSSSALWRGQWTRSNIQERSSTFRTWDIVLRLYLNKNFLMYAQCLNVFNRRYGGIDATGTPDDLLYNPQQRRLFRFGVNYSMN